MKFNVSSTALYAVLQALGRVIATKNAMPILDCFLFNLKDDKLEITASDVETKVVATVEVLSAEGAGIIAIDSKRLLESFKELPEQPLNIDINNEMMITVTYENGHFSLPGQDGSIYPQSRPLGESAVSITIDSKTIVSGINRTLFATGNDELRPVMNGICFDFQTDSFTFAATDASKLVRIRHNSINVENPAMFILPQKPANLLKAILKGSEEILISFDDKNACFKSSYFDMTCRLLEGRYPNYNGAIPLQNSRVATIDRLTFLNALKRVSVFSIQGSFLVKLQLADNQIVISAQDIDFATSGIETISCQYDADPLVIGFKASFLIEILANLTCPTVMLKLEDETRAGLVVPETNEGDEDVVMLLMPMHLNEY